MFQSAHYLLNENRINPIRWKQSKACPDCGIKAVAGEKVEMREACDVMWKRYNGLLDKACGMWSNCESIDVSGRLGGSKLPAVASRN